jgi:hypothetical protein
MWVGSEIFKNLPKANNRPLGENSPNLVTLVFRYIIKKRFETQVKKPLLPQATVRLVTLTPVSPPKFATAPVRKPELDPKPKRVEKPEEKRPVPVPVADVRIANAGVSSLREHLKSAAKVAEQVPPNLVIVQWSML